MAHAQKPDFVFRRNGQVHLNRRGRQFSRLLAAEVCASAVVMLDTPCSEVVWRVLTTHSIRQFPLHFPSRRHRIPSHFNWTLPARRLCGEARSKGLLSAAPVQKKTRFKTSIVTHCANYCRLRDPWTEMLLRDLTSSRDDYGGHCLYAVTSSDLVKSKSSSKNGGLSHKLNSVMSETTAVFRNTRWTINVSHSSFCILDGLMKHVST
jgi:hypothetical protein